MPGALPAQPVGWRTEPITRDGIEERRNIYAAITERTVCIGYEAVIAAVQIAP